MPNYSLYGELYKYPQQNLEEINTNDYNNINYEANNVNYDINNNQVTTEENNIQSKEENIEAQFSDIQNVYNENNIINNEEPKKEEDNQNENINILNYPGNNADLETKNIGSKYMDNENDNDIIKGDIFDRLEETKTFPLKNSKSISVENNNEMGNEVQPIAEVQKEEENSNNNENNINNLEIKEQEINDENKPKEENIMDISNQIKEIREMPENPFEQRDYIFNRKNIKVIKIEDEETQFCSALLTPLFKKLFG